MCLSRLGQIIYGVLAFAIVALTAAAMFTPGWRSFTAKVDNSTDDLRNGKLPSNINVGIFFCKIPTANSTSNISITIESTTHSTISNTATGTSGNFFNDSFGQTADYCKAWWAGLLPWEKIVVVGMILALGTALLAFIWNFIAFCACFCKGGITKPLPGLAGLTAIILAASLGIFYYYNKDYIVELKLKSNSTSNDLSETARETFKSLYGLMSKLGADKTENSKVSYSFYLGCAAAVAAFANMIVGSLIVCLSDKCL